MPDLDDFLTDLRVQLDRCADDAAARERRRAADAARRRRLQRPPLRRALALAAALAAGVIALAIGVVLVRPDDARTPSSGAALVAPQSGGGSAVYVRPPAPGSSGSSVAPAATAASYSLAAVAARTAADAWAVGQRQTGAGANHIASGASAQGSSFILRFDGVAWRESPAPDVGPLTAVAASAADRAWALSATGSLLAWDGRDWRVDPGAGTTGAQLRALAAPSENDVWVVGDLDGRPFAEHYDGAVWHVARLPETDSPSGTGSLNAVAASSPTDVWVVGAGDEAGLIPLAYHFDGVAWRSTTLDGASPTLASAPSPAALQCVASAGPGDVWATDGRLVFRWDGEQWRQDRRAPDETYRSLSVAGPAALWLVTDRGLVLWNGSSWEERNAASIGLEPRHVLNAEAVSARADDDIWVVGGAGASGAGSLPLLAHWNGTVWRIADDPVERR